MLKWEGDVETLSYRHDISWRDAAPMSHLQLTTESNSRKKPVSTSFCPRFKKQIVHIKIFKMCDWSRQCWHLWLCYTHLVLFQFFWFKSFWNFFCFIQASCRLIYLFEEASGALLLLLKVSDQNLLFKPCKSHIKKKKNLNIKLRMRYNLGTWSPNLFPVVSSVWT